ncbi:hypothetical protein [Chitinophaga sp.]|uniref:hypothetical protein n=1 Tax=Chitinophaga sp. TaxID=1869181 RepID=UPI0031D81FD4
MKEDVIAVINKRVKEFIFLDASIYKYHDDGLTLALSEDFTYFHNFEIRFRNVFTVISNTSWSLETKNDFIRILENSEESCHLNLKYGVVIGNSIFQLSTDEDKVFYIIAEDIELIDNVVRYYS